MGAAAYHEVCGKDQEMIEHPLHLRSLVGVVFLKPVLSEHVADYGLALTRQLVPRVEGPRYVAHESQSSFSQCHVPRSMLPR